MLPASGILLVAQISRIAKTKTKCTRSCSSTVVPANTKVCSYGHQKFTPPGLCPHLLDPVHTRHFTHPPPCPREGQCSETSEDHLRNYWHVPTCPSGPTCQMMNDKVHCVQFRHIQEACEYGTNCRMYSDKDHTQLKYHPFVWPCSRPFCSLTDKVLLTQIISDDVVRHISIKNPIFVPGEHNVRSKKTRRISNIGSISTVHLAKTAKTVVSY